MFAFFNAIYRIFDDINLLWRFLVSCDIVYMWKRGRLNDDVEKRMEINQIREQIGKEDFEKIHRLVYDYLFSNIISMKLCPGEKINIQHLAKELHISRSPIQKAVQQLEKENLLTGSATVTHLSYYEYKAIYEARICVEPRCAYLAAKRITASELATLKKLYKRMVEYENERTNSICGSDVEFHKQIVLASKSDWLIRFYEQYYSKVKRYRNYFALNNIGSVEHARHETSRSHMSILTAINNGMSIEAQESMRYDIEGMREVICLDVFKR